MTFASLLIEDVTITNPTVTGTDPRYGDPTESAGAPTVVKARVEPIAADEEIVGRDTRVTRYRVFMQADAPVTALSTLTYKGRKLRVTGDPLPFAGRSAAHHIELTAEELSG